MYWNYYERYKPARPKEAKGGIKAQSVRGSFAQKWWAKRWIAVLESFHIGQRLARGRSYARRGQVVSVDIGKGVVKAKVQGTRITPYSVAIEMNTLGREDRRKLIEQISSQAIYAAKLLAGEMPQDIEELFKKAGLSLFPTHQKDLKTHCSCPDSSNPCKHIAAVYYLIGEEFDRDPFLLFQLRGITREELMELLSSSTPEVPREQAREPLSCDPNSFWQGRELPEDWIGNVRIPHVCAALPTRLGNFPFWRGKKKFLDSVTPVYRELSPVGMNVFLAQVVHESERPEGL